MNELREAIRIGGHLRMVVPVVIAVTVAVLAALLYLELVTLLLEYAG